jgi:hypothetical protein
MYLTHEHEIRARLQEDGKIKVTVIKHGFVDTPYTLGDSQINSVPVETELQSFFAYSLEEVPGAVEDWLKNRKTAI